MGALFIFILISVLVVSAILFFNKGEKAQEIKCVLKDIYENFKELFSNLKKLFLIIKELIQSNSEQDTTKLKDESPTDGSAKSPSSNESTSLSSEVLESPSEDSNSDSTFSEPKVVIPDPEIVPTTELETTSDNSNSDKNLDRKN